MFLLVWRTFDLESFKKSQHLGSSGGQTMLLTLMVDYNVCYYSKVPTENFLWDTT